VPTNRRNGFRKKGTLAGGHSRERTNVLSFNEVTERASEYLDREPMGAAEGERLKVGLHIAMCKHCSRYLRQLDRTMKIVRLFPPDPPSRLVEDGRIESLRRPLLKPEPLVLFSPQQRCHEAGATELKERPVPEEIKKTAFWEHGALLYSRPVTRVRRKALRAAPVVVLCTR
jgi:hypothetical protein